jgi:hypothetical protein
MRMVDLIRRRGFLKTVCLIVGFGLSGCDRSATVNVNVHGVNYTDRVFSYVVRDPQAKDSSSGAGGELIDPFGAGGTMCCAVLPKVWRPGIRLQVDTTYWLDKQPDGKLPEIKQTRVVDVPRYVDGKPGELWVLREADGNVSVVSSDFQPDHPKWPGKVKGWPVPSLEYRRERWKIILDHEEEHVRNALHLLKQLKENPKGTAKESWENARRYDPSSIKSYFGPDDPQYVAYLAKDYEKYLEDSRSRVKVIMGEKP